MDALRRPIHSEYPEYYQQYVATVPDGNILHTLRDQLGETLELLAAVPEEKEGFRYAEGKWSVREVVGHMIDTERLFAYRALSMAREDGVVLPGMDQDVWARASRAEHRNLPDMSDEWTALRRANIHLFATFDESTAERRGVASDVTFAVRSFPWIIAGHELWHRRSLVVDYQI